jgi:hypothetical protein
MIELVAQYLIAFTMMLIVIVIHFFKAVAIATVHIITLWKKYIKKDWLRFKKECKEYYVEYRRDYADSEEHLNKVDEALKREDKKLMGIE